MKRWIAALVCLAAVGCTGEPRLDTTSEETFNASVEKIGQKLDDAGKKQLAEDMATITMTGAMKAVGQVFSNENAKGASTAPDVMKDLNGLTASQLHSKAEEIRSSLRR
jgi:hypothetical protein